MRCDIKRVRHLIQETLEGSSDVRMFSDTRGITRPAVKLIDNLQAAQVNAEVFFLPSDSTVRYLRSEAQRYAQGMTKDDPSFKLTPDSYYGRMLAKANHAEMAGIMLTLPSGTSKYQSTFSMQFPDDTICEVYVKEAWIFLSSEGADWRPDENLPEDYYAL